jgi:queuine tRNA-ribosyltransferase catalytic subunit
MGVGFALDLVVCCALGIDMFDCVFPTRTARFGCALVPSGQMQLRQRKYVTDFRPIDDECDCSTCKRYTRAFLHTIVTVEASACQMLSIHNLAYQVILQLDFNFSVLTNTDFFSVLQMRLMKGIRTSIKEDRFPQFVREFLAKLFPKGDYPKWVCEALDAVNIKVKI